MDDIHFCSHLLLHVLFFIMCNTAQYLFERLKYGKLSWDDFLVAVLGTNHVPTSAELDWFKSLLVNPQLELLIRTVRLSRHKSSRAPVYTFIPQPRPMPGPLLSEKSFWDIVPSPFASVLGTNRVPTSAELDQLRSLLIDSNREFYRLESEIQRAQTFLDDLLLKETKISRFIQDHKALMSPIRRIPTETLAEIFVHCLPTDHVYAVRDVKEAPLIFTVICREWRRIALNTPQLWNSLHIHVPLYLTADTCVRRAEGVTSRLERSGSLLLSVSFHADSRDAYPVPQRFEDKVALQNKELMIRTLIRFSDRFQDLSLALDPSDLRLFGRLCPSQFPALVSLRLRNEIFVFAMQDRSLQGVGLDTIFSRTPHLRQLELYQLELTSGIAGQISRPLQLDLSDEPQLVGDGEL
ncbi:hypothetical protein GYMLUDRAFT_599444 [Collybiopsis luxurians FD-317 M1]|uniref:F-box domain-containing protein n=1 Tax=Collybiopsis luxurians FD-317 M1 TaxID=944289 RepID=A0A0D0CEM1_9AGAR|nr:hypothetical protein GYMLUDRAFT_599444 [Collybiopsis luxurians FD-317 M1]